MPRKASLNTNSFLSQIKWGESYTSLFLGAVVVVVALILVFSFLKSKNLLKNIGTTTTSTNQSEQSAKQYPKTYTVKEGDDLWSISEKIYGSGYNWVDVAKANNLPNPNLLYVGTKLYVPNIAPKETTVQKAIVKNPITGSSYTVVKGDYLWEIAIRAYGDGYRWIEIAKANNLSNPNLIHPGNKFTIPRK